MVMRALHAGRNYSGLIHLSSISLEAKMTMKREKRRKGDAKKTLKMWPYRVAIGWSLVMRMTMRTRVGVKIRLVRRCRYFRRTSYPLQHKQST